MSNKTVTQMTDPEYKVEFDGKEMYVMCDGIKLAMRRDDCWVSIEPGVAFRDIVENGRHGIEVEYRRVTVHQRAESANEADHFVHRCRQRHSGLVVEKH